MPFITVGTASQLQLSIPTRSTTGYSATMLTSTWTKIAQHDHSGSGNGVQLTGSAFADDGITFAKIRGDNAEWLTARNAANSADKNIIRIDSSDEVAFGTTIASAEFQDDGLTIVDNSDNTKVIAFQASGITTGTTRTLTSPDASGVIVLVDATQTLTNKTLTTPIISSISNTGTITLPTATDTLVGRATTDTLTNKSIDSDNNTITNIVNADIKAAAAIALDKLAALTASRALVSDGSGFASAATTTATEIGYVNGVTSAIQTQIDGKLPTTLTTTGDIIYSSSGSTAARLAAGSNGEVLTLAAGVPSWAAVSVTPTATTSKTTTYTATTSDQTILADTSGGAWTLTLPAASGNDGFELYIKKTTSDFNALTIDGNASETIDGNTTIKLMTDAETVKIVCDGSNWEILEHSYNSAWIPWTQTVTASTPPTKDASPTWEHAAWRRVGDGIQMNWAMRQNSAGTAGSGSYGFQIPNNTSWTIDSAKVDVRSNGDSMAIGVCAVTHSGLKDGYVKTNDSTTVQLYVGTAAPVVVGSTNYSFSSSSAGYSFMVTHLPITDFLG